jgi:hypothetical protein
MFDFVGLQSAEHANDYGLATFFPYVVLFQLTVILTATFKVKVAG